MTGLNLLRVFIWAAAVALYLLGGRLSRKTLLLSLAAVTALSAASYINFGRFHGHGRFLHYHEFYHYYLGSKYFAELGYDGLYCATFLALTENDPAFNEDISVVKNLRTYQFERNATALERGKNVASLLSAERWEEFKRDIGFLQTKIHGESWDYVLVDHGFNATPFWIFVGSVFSRHMPLDDRTLALLAAFDPLLVLGMFLLAGWAFGAETALFFAVFFFTNSFATFDFTGGAFLRQLWLAFLVGFVGFFRKGRMIPAAFCLAVATMDRVFPVLFVLLPGILFVRETLARRSLRHAPARFLAAFAAAILLLGAVALPSAGGLPAWRSFYRNISAHGHWYSLNQISLRNLFIADPGIALRSHPAEWDDAAWLRERQTIDARTRNSLRAVRVVSLLLLLLFMAKERDPLASLGLLAFAPFLLLYPANYYYGFLGLTILACRGSPGLALVMMGLQIPFWLLNVVLPSPLDAERVTWLVSFSLFLTYAAFLAAGLRRHARGDRAFARTAIAGAAAGLVFIAGSAAMDARAPRDERAVADVLPGSGSPSALVLDVSPADVVQVSGGRAQAESMTRWGTGWTRNEHLVFLAEREGAQVTIAVRAPRDGTYRVKVVYSRTPVYGIVGLTVNGEPLPSSVDLYSPRVGLLPALYHRVALRAGVNEFAFMAEGMDALSSHMYFAVDRILIERNAGAGERGHAPAGGPAAPSPAARNARLRAALDRALVWVREHPADFFDGGLDDMGSECATLSALARRPATGDRRASFEEEARAVVAELDAHPAYRVPSGEYGGLVSIDLAARELGFDHPERSGASPASVGVDFVSCVDLARLHGESASRCPFAQSALHLEYVERRALPLVSGPVDRRAAPVVAGTMRVLAEELFALTAGGVEKPAAAFAETPGSGGIWTDDMWVSLCEGGLRWALATGDVITTACLIDFAHSLGIAGKVAPLSAALDYLLDSQEPDGSLGAADPRALNPRREGVLASMLAFSVGLEQDVP